MTTIRGIQRGRLVWQPDFQAELSSEGKWSGSLSFICHGEDAVTLMPAKGASCPEVGFSFMGLDSVSVATLEGGLKQVTCKYAAGGESGDFGFDDPTTTGRSELAISVSEEPLETNSRYKEVSEEDLYKIQDLKSGRYKVLPPVEGEPTKYVQRVDGEGVKEISFSEELAAELASKITRGFTTYLQANQIYRLTVVSNSEVSAAKLNKVGKITSAPGAPEVGGSRNWLFMGVTSTNEGNRAFTHTFEWRLSDVSGWDEDIYSGEEEE